MDLTIVSLVGITTRRAETIVRYYELMTAPSYIHTRRCSHASLLQRSSAYMNTRGHAHAYTTIHFNLIVNIYRLQCIVIAIDYNNRKPVQSTMNCNRTQVQCEQHWNNTRTEPNIIPPPGSAQPTALLVRCKVTGAVGQVSFRFPCQLKHRIPTPLHKILHA